MNPNHGVALKPRERALLNYFHAHAGRVLSRDEISLQVWGFIMDPRSRTIDQTVARVRKVIGRQRVVTHQGRGYEFLQA